MDTVKIGKFLAELRHERNLTQEQLAEQLGTSNKTISRWENGNYMPPLEMLMELSEFYSVSINELLSGRRLESEEVESAAEENLKETLKISAFTIEERKAFFTKKWKREHSFELILGMIVLLFALAFGIIKEEILILVTVQVLSFVFGIATRNRMMAYVERHAFDEKIREVDKKS
ncbi:MAG: helix-turn-helix domain-containing protein [Oscillospiraceae bacterium]|nr:helix-turn-helix domain-containing protein [Oscillospiraceae bacterium]